MMPDAISLPVTRLTRIEPGDVVVVGAMTFYGRVKSFSSFIFTNPSPVFCFMRINGEPRNNVSLYTSSRHPPPWQSSVSAF